jgi:hypothetical protein
MESLIHRFWRRLSGKARRRMAVPVTLVAPREIAGAARVTHHQVDTLVEQLRQHLSHNALGELDDYEVSEDEVRVYFNSSEPNALIVAMLPLLRATAWCHGSHVRIGEDLLGTATRVMII